ncbi:MULTISPECIES: chemotaxis protein CheW [Nguyenibacter]|uniref:Chemotaxis protein CheW n=1 Tax=Nguyenibacter vanlangensis TaxID=1216886 RepID=A0A7Y7M3M2_9PROT|nr:MULTISPECIES: chemotaxis protein CheW [Nguyenibacter]NVN09850.1 purine-binding chemotaxis protein CheW [Nguyenibacter vanlangensis]WRH89697.1 chemotaxis protein CheW [Nguyenibacter sp. L1]
MTEQTEVADATIVKMIMFAIGEQEYCIPILSVREIRGFEKTTTLPFAPPYVCGAINLRGVILTVIDLAVYLNVPPQADNPRRVVVFVESQGGVVCGLLVDRVIDMADIDLGDVQSVSDDGSSLGGLVLVDNRMIGVLRLETVVGQLVGDTVSA